MSIKDRFYSGKLIEALVADDKNCRIPIKVAKKAEKAIKSKYGKVEEKETYIPKRNGVWVKAIDKSTKNSKVAYSGKTIQCLVARKDTSTVSGKAAHNAKKDLKRIDENATYENIRYTKNWRKI